MAPVAVRIYAVCDSTRAERPWRLGAFRHSPLQEVMTRLLAPLRPITYLVVSLAVVGFGIDAGSVALTRLSVPDQVRQAGYAGAAAAEGMPTSRQAAQVALEAAANEARPHGLTVKPKSFTLYPDGRVSLTASRRAPTLLLDKVAALRHFTKVKSTVTVSPLPYS